MRSPIVNTAILGIAVGIFLLSFYVPKERYWIWLITCIVIGMFLRRITDKLKK